MDRCGDNRIFDLLHEPWDSWDYKHYQSSILLTMTTLATMRHVKILNMPLQEWQYESCTAHFATGDDPKKWATAYDVESKEEKKGHATELLRQAKEYYEKQGRFVGGTVALNPHMKSIYQKLGYHEYD